MSEKIQQLEARLEAISKEDPDSTSRVDAMLDLAEALVSGDNPQRMVDIVAEAQDLARRLDYRRGEAYSALYTSVSCCFTAKHEEGLEQTSESRAIFEGLEDEFGLAKTEIMEGNLLRSIGSFDQALPHFYKSLEYFRNNGKAFWEAMCHYDLGLLFLDFGDNSKAREHFNAAVSGDIGLHRWVEARALNGLGTADRNMGDLEAAINHYHQSLKIFREIRNAMGEARALDDIGSIHYQMGDPAMALEFHRKSCEIRREIGQRRAQSTSLLNIARAHLVSEDHAQAFPVLEEALAIAEETKSRSQVYEAHRLLSTVYELRGDPAKALAHFKTFETTKDEVFNEQTSERLHRLQIGFTVERAQKEAEIAHLKNVELRKKNDSLESLLKELQATQGQLVQAEKLAAVGKLVAGLLHEMNTPMGASNTAMDVCERCIEKIAVLKDAGDASDGPAGKELNALLSRIQDSHAIARDAHSRISKILGSLKSFIRLDGSERQVADLHEGLEATLALLEHEFKERIQIVRRYGELPGIGCYPGEVNQVFMTLLSNAIESIPDTGTIAIQTSVKNDHACIEISDTGVGIEPDRLPQLFDPGFSTKGRRIKAGMGLLVGLNIVQKHGGRIDVDSSPGVGSTFTIVLPASPH